MVFSSVIPDLLFLIFNFNVLESVVTHVDKKEKGVYFCLKTNRNVEILNQHFPSPFLHVDVCVQTTPCPGTLCSPVLPHFNDQCARSRKNQGMTPDIYVLPV